MIELSRYVFEALRKGKDCGLYRGRSVRGGPQVLVLSPQADYPTLEILKWLENAYSLREELDFCQFRIIRFWREKLDSFKTL